MVLIKIRERESYIISLSLSFNIFFFCYPEILVTYIYNIVLQTFIS
jgi:hypothetical protein